MTARRQRAEPDAEQRRQQGNAARAWNVAAALRAGPFKPAWADEKVGSASKPAKPPGKR